MLGPKTTQTYNNQGFVNPEVAHFDEETWTELSEEDGLDWYDPYNDGIGGD